MRILIAGLLVFALPWSAGAFHPGTNVSRGIYCHPGGAISTTVWGAFRTPGEYVIDAPHGGEAALKCDNSGGGRGTGAGCSQRITLDQQEAKPLKIAGWSKAQDVQGGQSYEYSLYVDLTYADGEAWPMKIAAFSPGTHDWEYAETIIEPTKPLKSAAVHAFIREKSGIVWFDDLFFGEPEGENLLRNPGFEPETRVDTQRRDELLAQYEDLNANAMHIYLSPNAPIWESDLLDKHYEGPSPLAEFLAFLKDRGIGVWVTTGALSQPFTGVDDERFPAYYCPNEKWGENWVSVLGDIAKCDLAGVSLVPDEYNYNNGRLKSGYAKHADEAVAQFYQEMPYYCDGPGCRAKFKQAFGADMPDLHETQQTDDWRDYINFRYMTTNEWLRKGAEAVKQANPDCLADSLICVTPVCSDRWWSVGVAWDEVGYGTQIDFLTTDPYILLHNYLGDSTHWYVTETCERLSGAHPKRQCGSVLEASRLRPQFRELAPVEVYGSALTSVFHGAKELAWWHHSHITGASPTAEDSEKTYQLVKSTYQMLKEVDPWLEELVPLKRVALLHSRASEDWWRFYSTPEPAQCLTHQDKDARYASRAQVEVLMHCLRGNVPVDLYYLESVTAEQLADYPIIVVPFAFAIDDDRVELLRALAEEGKRVLVISEVGTLTQDGKVRDRPALLDLVGLKSAPSGEQTGLLSIGPLNRPGETSFAEGVPLDDELTTYAQVEPSDEVIIGGTVGDVPVLLARPIGTGFVAYLAGEFGIGLPESYDNEVRSREVRVYPPSFRATPSGILTALYAAALDGDAPALLTTSVQYEDAEPEFPDDVEVVVAQCAMGYVALCTNWTDGTASLEWNVNVSRLPGAAVQGRAITPDGEVTALDAAPTTLRPQESCVFLVLP